MGSVIALGSWFVLVVAARVEWQGHTLARIFLLCRWVLVFVVVCDAWGGLLWFCGGIRVMPSCFWRCRSVFWCLRWHPRFAFVLHASPLGVLALALASAFCLRVSSVAPVRGGTYFSLPPQRKVGKRKRLTPLALVFA
ncbi:hypothetical protein [Paraburkholderia sp. SIMBA_054]|uniref:hypothetical protein n=1 Tax=Paraburkholderia TaxID=1822464 RepID=UPI00397A4C7A